MASSNMEIVESYEKSNDLVKRFEGRVVRLQAKLGVCEDKHVDEVSLRNHLRNIDRFFELSRDNRDTLFVLVTGGTVCYWTFFNGKRGENYNCYNANHKIEFEREKIDSLFTAAAASGATTSPLKRRRSPSPSKGQEAPIQQQNISINILQAPSTRGAPQCFKCRKYGHYSKHCPFR